jgi:hypothetical protein
MLCTYILLIIIAALTMRCRTEIGQQIKKHFIYTVLFQIGTALFENNPHFRDTSRGDPE